MASGSDLRIEFDVVNACRYAQSITRFVGAIIAVGIACVSYSITQASDVFVEFAVNHGVAEIAELGPSRSGVFTVAGAALAVDYALAEVVVPWLLRRTLESQRCRITATQIVSESGWLNHMTQTIPLDRIQDLTVKQGFLQQHFGIWTLEVQTAGSPSPFPELVLRAPKNAPGVRDAIMIRRDALVAKSYEPSLPAADSASAGEVEQSGVVAALTELNRTMLRIEKLLAAKG